MDRGFSGRPVNFFRRSSSIPIGLWRLSLSPTALRLYGVLTDFVDDRGTCYPSNRKIMDRLPDGADERTLRRAKTELLSRGLLVFEPRHDPSRRQTSNRYWLTFPAPDAAKVEGGQEPLPEGGYVPLPEGGQEPPPGSSTRAKEVDHQKEEETTSTLSGSPPDIAPTNGHHLPQHKADALEILGWLNKKAGTRFEPVEANLSLIRARLKEADRPAWRLKQLVSAKATEWPPGHDMRKYLRPATLFNREKCAQYLGQLPPPKETPG